MIYKNPMSFIFQKTYLKWKEPKQYTRMELFGSFKKATFWRTIIILKKEILYIPGSLNSFHR